VDPAWVAERCRPWDLAAPFGTEFVVALAERVGARVGTLDVVLAGPDGPAASLEMDLRPATPAETAATLADAPHPRWDVRVRMTPDGLGVVVVGRGLEDRWEAMIHVDRGARGGGLGRRLAVAAASLVDPGERVFAQIAPGNVASLQAALAADYRPVSAEILFFDR
jgi:hypothetical protein